MREWLKLAWIDFQISWRLTKWLTARRIVRRALGASYLIIIVTVLWGAFAEQIIPLLQHPLTWLAVFLLSLWAAIVAVLVS